MPQQSILPLHRRATPDAAKAPARRGLAVFVIALTLALAACDMLPEVKDATAGYSAERLYADAHDLMRQGNYTAAVKSFETLESRYPYGRYAQQAIIESAYSNYRAGETAAAISQCDRFIRTYPNHPSVDYMYYLKGLVYFREDQGLLGYVYELDLSEREPKAMRESYAAFKDMSAKFPDSKYTPDAIDRMRYLVNALAMYDVHVARYYYNRGAYVAAVNRAEASLTTYPRTPANEQALIMMVQAYDKLGMIQLRDDAKGILQRTYPESPYLTGVDGTPWWKFWSKSAYVAPSDAKPWWQWW